MGEQNTQRTFLWEPRGAGMFAREHSSTGTVAEPAFSGAVSRGLATDVMGHPSEHRRAVLSGADADAERQYGRSALTGVVEIQPRSFDLRVRVCGV
ncbi:MAG: hypothetical protein CL424_03690 [Acidimicrobiaceae bacterium]|nr:hypothetical protein [Acidimicrobiaceae bacterium]